MISRYDQIHGRNSFQRDKAAGFDEPERLEGDRRRRRHHRLRVVVRNSGADKGLRRLVGQVNAGYRGQLVGRAVDLVQLFPAAAYGKNGADIRLAVDAVEDMFRLPDLTHVVIVAGDSDYIALAQRCKQLGRYVVGIGVAGSTSRSLTAACDEFVSYDGLPGVPTAVSEAAPKKRSRRAAPNSTSRQRTPQAAATDLLQRALRIGLEKDDVEWLHNSAVKAQ